MKKNRTMQYFMNGLMASIAFTVASIIIVIIFAFSAILTVFSPILFFVVILATIPLSCIVSGFMLAKFGFRRR